jgi:hypothetical protein
VRQGKANAKQDAQRLQDKAEGGKGNGTFADPATGGTATATQPPYGSNS